MSQASAGLTLCEGGWEVLIHQVGLVTLRHNILKQIPIVCPPLYKHIGWERPWAVGV